MSSPSTANTPRLPHHKTAGHCPDRRLTHDGQVLAQRQIDSKSNEIPAFAPLLNGLDLTGAVITADALHTQHDHASYLHERGAHYLAVVKKNHPQLHQKVRRLPWRDIHLDHCERARGHHREEMCD
ncbi:ISAs1 family transposase [Streptomyces sp. NPDC058867]|uniref:ISAs1 family transposase n=1 Tax=unclassified Streptomyces TaxID=2593676 RepID=UPI0036CAC527